MLYRLKRQTYFFKVKTMVKDINEINTDLPKRKNFFAEFVFTNFYPSLKLPSTKFFKTDQSKTVIYTFYQYFK